MIEYFATLLALIITLSVYSLPVVGVILLIRAIRQKKVEKKTNYTPPTAKKEPKWYPSGWVFNEETQLWDPPDYLNKESKDRWKWDSEKGIWIDLDKERRLERYKKAHEGREPTYEEWKAEKLKKELEATPKNTTTEQGTYRYDYIHTPNEQQQHFHHNDTTFKTIQQPQNKPTEVKKEEKQAEEKKPSNLSQEQADTNKPYRTAISQATTPNATTPQERKTEYKPNYNTYVAKPKINNNAERYVKPDKTKNTGYKARNLLTRNEWNQYQRLQEYAAKKDLLVQTKVRLADLVHQGYGKGSKTRFRKVSQKHVDFVLVDKNMKIKAILELDDSTHDQPDRIERDQLVDEILSSAGYTVIHTRNITEHTLDGI